MKHIFLILFVTFLGLYFLAKPALSIEDPLLSANNKFGIHILFPSEISKAASLINTNGGDWGYVTIPIQSGDRNLDKWQKFMDDCSSYHIIPIIRLATEGDYFNTKVWRKPTREDVLDFANFLNSLHWPIKNRYIVVFNEVNRGDEWEGKLSPREYAEILDFSSSVFKSLSSDFYIISSGLDNAAPNETGKYMNQYDYMVQMNAAIPGIFNKIDGLGSHSYPNPGFKQLPYFLTNQNVGSFVFEKNLAYRLSGKNLLVFITETGWSKKMLSEKEISAYVRYTFENVWSDKNVVAVTLFLLEANTEPFSQFSLINNDGGRNLISENFLNIRKTKGQPTINRNSELSSYFSYKDIPFRIFPKEKQYKEIPVSKVNAAEEFFKWFLRLYI